MQANSGACAALADFHCQMSTHNTSRRGLRVLCSAWLCFYTIYAVPGTASALLFARHEASQAASARQLQNAALMQPPPSHSQPQQPQRSTGSTSSSRAAPCRGH